MLVQTLRTSAVTNNHYLKNAHHQDRPSSSASLSVKIETRPHSIESSPLPYPPSTAHPRLAGGKWLASQVAVLLASHAVVDSYAAIVPATLGLLESRCGLETTQTAIVAAVVSLVGGLAQPICAMLSDRYDSRFFGGLGLAVAAICLSFIGWVTNYSSLLLLVALGYLGVGMFHPIAASSIGQISDRRRSLAMGAFFVAGMLGGAMGAYGVPRWVVSDQGFSRLGFWSVPGLAMAITLYFMIRNVPHRMANHQNIAFPKGEIRSRWLMVALLYISTTMRAIVYTTLLYMYVRWIQAEMLLRQPTWSRRQIADAAAPLVGDLNAMTLIGMAAGGLAAGVLVTPGREKRPLIMVPMLFAPAIYWLPHGGHVSACVLGLLAGIGFASMSPVALSVSQRLLPHRTSLASSLMLGGAWAVAAGGAAIAEVGIRYIGVYHVFQCCAAVLFSSGLLALPLRRSQLSQF